MLACAVRVHVFLYGVALCCIVLCYAKQWYVPCEHVYTMYAGAREDGTEINTDQTACDDCEPGKFSTRGSNCMPCPKDTYSDIASGDCNCCCQ